ncbi:MAG: hypothetical protein H6721_14295 [Sandaracinus sp.]|nr:hypothetical protein [Sandaracinus sp.]MCB9611302.1 hypothetical protein [Sandaracinus sp.]MCB9633286.1 hypothetical protein [Sandaracinus sp.]
MAKTYINIPVTDEEKARIERTDATWTGPKLIVLLALTLGTALVVLWLAANGHIVPQHS